MNYKIKYMKELVDVENIFRVHNITQLDLNKKLYNAKESKKITIDDLVYDVEFIKSPKIKNPVGKEPKRAYNKDKYENVVYRENKIDGAKYLLIDGKKYTTNQACEFLEIEKTAAYKFFAKVRSFEIGKHKVAVFKANGRLNKYAYTVISDDKKINQSGISIEDVNKLVNAHNSVVVADRFCKSKIKNKISFNGFTITRIDRRDSTPTEPKKPRDPNAKLRGINAEKPTNLVLRESPVPKGKSRARFNGSEKSFNLTDLSKKVRCTGATLRNYAKIYTSFTFEGNDFEILFSGDKTDYTYILLDANEDPIKGVLLLGDIARHFGVTVVSIREQLRKMQIIDDKWYDYRGCTIMRSHK